MTPDQTCKNCRWWASHFGREDYAYGHCHRHSPVALRPFDVMRDGAERQFCQAVAMFPGTRGDDFCGDFQPHENTHTPSAAFTQRVAELRAEARFEEHPKP